MKCLCCGKTIRENASNAEKSGAGIKKCEIVFYDRRNALFRYYEGTIGKARK